MAHEFIKTRFGIPLVDEEFSGVYLKRTTFINGVVKEGREIAILQTLACYYSMNEMSLLVTSSSLEQLSLRAREIGFNINKAVDDGALLILNYAGTAELGKSLPLNETLQEIVSEAQRVNAARLVIDDARPWLEVRPVTQVADRVKEFLEILKASEITSIVALPEPVSPAAKKVVAEMTEQTAITVHFSNDPLDDYYGVEVRHYAGLTADIRLPFKMRHKFVPGKGLVMQQANSVRQRGGSVAEPVAAPRDFVSAVHPKMVDFGASLLGGVPAAPAASAQHPASGSHSAPGAPGASAFPLPLPIGAPQPASASPAPAASPFPLPMPVGAPQPAAAPAAAAPLPTPSAAPSIVPPAVPRPVAPIPAAAPDAKKPIIPAPMPGAIPANPTPRKRSRFSLAGVVNSIK